MQRLKQKTTYLRDVFGVAEQHSEQEYNLPTLSPFDFVNTINYTKNNLMVDQWAEKQYNKYVINKALSFASDTVIHANEMNARPHIPVKMQYNFLINNIRPKKRFSKWIKKDKIQAVDVIKEYYGYSTEKAHQVLTVLSKEQITSLREILESKRQK